MRLAAPVLLLMLFLGACSTTAPREATSDGVRIDQLRSEQPLRPVGWSAEQLMPGEAVDAPATRRERDQATDTRLRIEPKPDDRWLLTVEGEAAALYELGPEGELRVLREDDVSEGVSVSYEPGLVVLPRAARQGVVVEGDASITVRDLASGRLRDRGRVTYRVEVLGEVDIVLGEANVPATVTRMHREIDLRLADADVNLTRAWVVGEGLVAEAVDRRVRALGLIPSSSRHVLERRQSPASP